MSNTIPTYILKCDKLVAICMYKLKKTWVSLDEIYTEFININKKLHKKYPGSFALYSNIYIKEMLHDYNDVFVKHDNIICLHGNKNLSYLEKHILSYMQYDLLKLTLQNEELTK
ncbi:MAG: hypothetical protein E7376_02190 [Clostridiales bacterium]|nr:hypothetical protein [Clostridiales bacterium]